jgi:hypothetical protein
LIPGAGRSFFTLVRTAKKPQDPVADIFLDRIIAGRRTLLGTDLPVRDECNRRDGKKGACRANYGAPQRYSAATRHCGTNIARNNSSFSGQLGIIQIRS